jgi:hypothetical protein
MNVVPLGTRNLRDLSGLWDSAERARLTDAIIIGVDQEGAFWHNANFVDGPTALWLLEYAKAMVLKSGGIL